MDSSRSKIITPVYYRSSQSRFPKSAVLEVTEHDQVRITVNNPEGVGEVVVDAPLSQVQKLRVFRGSLMRLYVNDHLYWVDIDTLALKRNAHDPRYGNARKWIDLLKQQGIPARSIGFWAFALIPIIVVAVLEIIVLIARIITGNI